MIPADLEKAAPRRLGNLLWPCLVLLCLWGAPLAAAVPQLPGPLAAAAELPVSLRAAALTAIAEAGLPLVSGREAIFLARSARGVAPRLVADFNGWGRYPSAPGADGGRMEAIEGTVWFWAAVDLPADARIEYGYDYGDAEPRTDAHNPRAVRTFGMLRSVLEMPGYAPSPWIPAQPSPPAGRVERLEPGTALGTSRAIHVYLPRGYPADGPYPVAYFNDGTEYLEQVGVPAILDAMIDGRAIRPVIGVFVAPLDRGVEYRGQAAFMDLMTRRIVPEIDARYETIASSEWRAIVGGSRGALGALHLAWGTGEVFGLCGMLSPAISPSDVLAGVAGQEARPVRFHVVGGAHDVRFVGDYHNTVDALRVSGHRVRHRIGAFGHSWNSWKHYIPEMLIDFFGLESD